MYKLLWTDGTISCQAFVKFAHMVLTREAVTAGVEPMLGDVYDEAHSVAFM